MLSNAPKISQNEKSIIVTFDNFTDIDIFLAWDLLNRVKHRDKDFQVKIVGTQASHRSVRGLDIATHGLIEECNDADLVFFGSGVETRKLIKDNLYLDRFKLNPQKQIICSMCSGALLIAALGHLTGLSATTYPTVFETLKSYDVNVIEDHHLVTHGISEQQQVVLPLLTLLAGQLKKCTTSKSARM